MTTHENSSEETSAGGAREPDHLDRAYEHFRKVHVRNMIARGQAPIGYRINDDRTGFVMIGNPAWPVRPLDPHCTQYSVPSLELAALIRKFLPDFDPEADRRGWLEVAEFVLRTGRPAADVQAMGHDELVAFFRHEAFHAGQKEAVRGAGQLSPSIAAVPAPPGRDSHVQTEGTGRLPAQESAAQAIRRMLSNPTDRARLVEAGSAAGVAKLIGKSPSAVKEAGRPWEELCELLLVNRTNRRTLREMKRGRKS